MSDNMREDAIREAARNHAMDEYFNARPPLPRTRNEERLFEAGFDRGMDYLTRLAQAEHEIERLRKDAERYRWLRDDAFEHSDDCFFEAGRLFAGHQGDSFDVAIDAAIAQGKGE